MKKITALFLAAVFCLMLVSCSSLRTEETKGTSAPSKETSPVTEPQTESTSDTEPSTEPATEAPTDTTEPVTEPPVTVPAVIPTPEPGAPKHIVIDAGHGYVDPGCTSEFLDGKYERDIVAEIALELKAALEAKGFAVTLLRDDSRYVTADEIAAAADAVGLEYMRDKLVDDSRFAAYNRAVWANVLHREKYMDAYISLHIDAYPASSDVRGTRIYYCSENGYSPLSERLCAALTEQLGEALPDMRPRYFAKSWEDGFAVTKHAQMPSVLVEMGFATNEKDAKYILDPQWREEFAEAMANGAVQFFE